MWRMSSWPAFLYLSLDTISIPQLLRSITRTVILVATHFLGVDCNDKIQAIFVTVSVPIISGLDPDTFTLVRRKGF